MSRWDDAACADLGRQVAIFYEPIPSYVSRARFVCSLCPSSVRAACLADALDSGEQLGIRAGMTPAERQGLQPSKRHWSRRKYAA